MMRRATPPLPLARRGSRVAATAVIFYVVCLLASAPADVLARFVEHSTDGFVTLEKPGGSLWRGNARALLVSGSRGLVRFSNITWRLNLDLVEGAAAMRLDVDDAHLRGMGRIVPGRGGLHVLGAVLRFPASSLPVLAPALVTAGLSGDVAVRTDDVFVDRSGFRGAVLIHWRNAASALSTVAPLGEYRAAASKIGRQIEFTVETIQGPLYVEGRGTWSPEGGLLFEGTSWAERDQADALQNVLRSLGVSSDGGRARFRMQGNG